MTACQVFGEAFVQVNFANTDVATGSTFPQTLLTLFWAR